MHRIGGYRANYRARELVASIDIEVESYLFGNKWGIALSLCTCLHIVADMDEGAWDHPS